MGRTDTGLVGHPLNGAVQTKARFHTNYQQIQHIEKSASVSHFLVSQFRSHKEGAKYTKTSFKHEIDIDNFLHRATCDNGIHNKRFFEFYTKG